MDWSKYAPEFKYEKFTCKCGCGLNNMTESHMDRLIYARRYSGCFYVVRSGSRCAKHNKEEGGSDTSDHLTGDGTDIEALTSSIRWKIITGLMAAGFTRIGVGKTFVHAGTGPDNAKQVIWLY